MTDIFINLGLSKTQAGDVSLLLLMILASVVLMFAVKKTKIAAFAYTVYAAYFITETLYFDFIKTYTVKIVVFLILALILHYALFKPTVKVKLSGGNIIRWVKRTIIAFMIVGFMATIVLGWMPDKEVAKMLSPIALKIFTTKAAGLVWAVAPLLVLFATRRKD